jgi:type II secretory pathway pseudopilin PulG
VSRVVVLCALMVITTSGCAYRIGAGVTAGALDELDGSGRSDGIEGVTAAIAQRAALADIGHQIGAGLSSGVTDITPEQQARLEAAIDSALLVAATRTGRGLRTEVSPALRELVRRDIVQALAEGMRNDVGASAEEVVDRVVQRASSSLKVAVRDPELHEALADLIRDSVYYSMEEGRPGVSSVGDTLAFTLQRSVLAPMEQSVASVSENVASKVEAAGRRTENTLRAVIVFLGVVLAVVGIMYTFTRRQLLRKQHQVQEAEQELRQVGAALNLLDTSTRDQILGKLDQARHGVDVLHAHAKTTAEPPAERRSDYARSTEVPTSAPQRPTDGYARGPKPPDPAP